MNKVFGQDIPVIFDRQHQTKARDLGGGTEHHQAVDVILQTGIGIITYRFLQIFCILIPVPQLEPHHAGRQHHPQPMPAGITAGTLFEYLVRLWHVQGGHHTSGISTQ